MNYFMFIISTMIIYFLYRFMSDEKVRHTIINERTSMSHPLFHKSSNLDFSKDMEVINEMASTYARFTMDEYVNKGAAWGERTVAYSNEDYSKCVGIVTSGVLNALSKKYKYHMCKYLGVAGLEKLILFKSREEINKIFDKLKAEKRIKYTQDMEKKAVSRDINKIIRSIQGKIGKKTMATLGRGFNSHDMATYGDIIQEVAESEYFANAASFPQLSPTEYDKMIDECVDSIIPEIQEHEKQSQHRPKGLSRDMQYFERFNLDKGGK